MFLVTLVKTILQNAKVVNDELDEDTRLRMQHRAEFLHQQMTWMLEELDHKAMEQNDGSWGSVLWAALLQWQFWAIAGVLVLLVALCWQLRKRGCKVLTSCQLSTSKPVTPAPHTPIPNPTPPIPIPTALNPFTFPLKLKLREKSKCKPVSLDKNRLTI